MNQFPKKKKFKNVKITVNQSANSRDVEVKGQEKISVKYEQFAKDVQAINNDNVEVQILDFSNLPFVKFLKKPSQASIHLFMKSNIDKFERLLTWPPGQDFVFLVFFQDEFRRVKQCSTIDPTKIEAFLIDENKMIIIEKNFVLNTIPNILQEIPSLVQCAHLRLNMDQHSFPNHQKFLTKAEATIDTGNIKFKINRQIFQGKVINEIPKLNRKNFSNQLLNGLLANAKDPLAQDLQKGIYAPIEFQDLQDPLVIKFKVNNGKSYLATLHNLLCQEENITDELRLQILNKLKAKGSFFAKPMSPIDDDYDADQSGPILIDVLLDDFNLAQILLNDFLKGIAKPLKTELSDLPSPDLSDKKMVLQYIGPSETQNENLFTRKAMRDRLEQEIYAMIPYLEVERKPDENTILLLKCSSKNPNFLMRARVSKRDGLTMALDCIDYGTELQMKKVNQIWMEHDELNISYMLYKYPLNLRRYPLLTFTLKLQGIPAKRTTMETTKKLTRFFQQHNKVKIGQVTDFFKREVSIFSRNTETLETNLLVILEGYQPKTLQNGMYVGFNCNFKDETLWIILQEDLGKLEKLHGMLKKVFQLLLEEELERYQPQEGEFCFYVDYHSETLIRVAVSKQSQMVTHQVDLGMNEVVNELDDTPLFIPSPSLHPNFYQELLPIKNVLLKCDFPNHSPMAIPCVMKNPNELKNDFVTFEVIGTQIKNGLNVNLIIVQE